MMAARARDLFIFKILGGIEENNFRKLSKKAEQTFRSCFDRGKDSSSFYPATNYMPDIATLKTLGLNTIACIAAQLVTFDYADNAQ